MEVQRNHEVGHVTHAYIAGLIGRPILPSVGDLVETLDEKITEKAPCSGKVRAVKDGDVCVGWSDCLEVVGPRGVWREAYYSPANDRRGPYWCIGDRRPRFSAS